MAAPKHRSRFLSTPSARRATPKYHEKQYNRSDFYPRPLRGGRPVNNGCSETPQQISIHALCEEGDPRRRLLLPLCRNFYPRPLRGGRLDAGKATIMANLFLSTPSARRATIAEQADTIELLFLSTPSARRATRLPGGLGRVPNISIHALCEEGDVVVVVVGSVEMLFLSTPSARRATKSCTATTKSVTNFYPRPLRGGRRIPQRLIHNDRRFLSTPSARRATQRQHHLRRRRGISIHALCEEGDRRSGCTSQLTQRFLSTPSARRATRCTCPEAVAAYEFLSTPSARRATRQLSVKRSDQS